MCARLLAPTRRMTLRKTRPLCLLFWCYLAVHRDDKTAAKAQRLYPARKVEALSRWRENNLLECSPFESCVHPTSLPRGTDTLFSHKPSRSSRRRYHYSFLLSARRSSRTRTRARRRRRRSSAARIPASAARSTRRTRPGRRSSGRTGGPRPTSSLTAAETP